MSKPKRRPAPARREESGRKRPRPSELRARRDRRRKVMIAGASIGMVGLVFVVGVLALARSSSDPSIPSESVTFTGSDFAYSPDVGLGLAGEIEVTLRNDGPGAHDLAILRPGIRISDHEQYLESMSVGALPWTAPEDESSGTFDLAPGTYQVVCLIPGHLAEGMEGELIVTEATSN